MELLEKRLNGRTEEKVKPTAWAVPIAAVVAGLCLIFGAPELALASISTTTITGTYLFLIFFVAAMIALGRRGRVIAKFVSPELKLSTPIAVLVLLVALRVGSGLIVSRFAIDYGPSGFDTPAYLFLAESSQLAGGFLVSQTFPFPLAIVSLLVSTGLPLETVGMLLPLMFGLFYILSVYWSTLVATREHSVAALASLLAPLSFFFIRLTYDLYSQIFALSLTLLALAYYGAEIATSRKLKVVVILTILIIFSHIYTFGFFAITIILDTLISHRTRFPRKQVLLGVAPLALTIVTVVLLASPVLERVARLVLGEISPLSPPSQWYWIGRKENPIFLFLGVLGIVLSRNVVGSKFWRVLIIWSSVLSIGILASGYQQTYRLIILYPTAILSAAALLAILGLFRNFSHAVKQAPSTTWILDKGLPVILLALVLLGSMAYAQTVSYVPDLRYRPPDNVMGELYQIRHEFGFSNKSLVVLVPDTVQAASDNLYNWALAITGSNLYQGSLDGYLSGSSDRHGVSPWNQVEFAVSFSGYGIDPRIWTLSEEPSAGVFVTNLVFPRSGDFNALNEKIDSMALWELNLQNTTYEIITAEIPYYLNKEGEASLSLRINQTAKAGGWVTFGAPIPSVSGGTYAFISYRGNFTAVEAYFEVYSSQGFIHGANLNSGSSIEFVNLDGIAPVRFRIATLTDYGGTASVDLLKIGLLSLS